MVTVERTALVGHEAAQMYALVEDIEAYPRFLPWCSAAEVSFRDEHRTVGTLHVDYRGVQQQFTTENAKRPGASIEMRLVRGPFRQLHGVWGFHALDVRACRVELRLVYQFANPLLDRLVGPVFHHIANSYVDAFVRRAEALYGRG